MGQVSINNRSFPLTPELKSEAIRALRNLFEIVPDSARFRWTIGRCKDKATTFAELVLEGYRDFRLTVRDEKPNLQDAIESVSRKIEGLILQREPSVI